MLLTHSYRSDIPMAPCSDSINLLEWLAEVREILQSLDDWFVIKGYDSGTARFRDAQGEAGG